MLIKCLFPMNYNFLENTLESFESSGKDHFLFYRLASLEEDGIADISRLPYSKKILLEAAIRHCREFSIESRVIEAIASPGKNGVRETEIPFFPARVVLQDFTGVPALVDLASMRNALEKLGGDPEKINPLLPAQLVIDHSVQIDFYGAGSSLKKNLEKEFERNRERYEFLKWGQNSFNNFDVIPPSGGIVHQVNLEYLSKGVQQKKVAAGILIFPDSLVGTDSHTTMVNGLGILGWGVGGIEAEAVMLGQPIYMLLPKVVGFKITGKLSREATSTDIALYVTQILREKNVVGKFIEFYGKGLSSMPLPDRATISNMAPEYGATASFFPIDVEALSYLEKTGRPKEDILLVRDYMEAQGLFRWDDTPDPVFDEYVELDLSTIKPSIAGPKRPQDRIDLDQVKIEVQKKFTDPVKENGYGLSPENLGESFEISPGGEKISHGSVAIASITSCTNTSNPILILTAALLAKKAVEKGLNVPSFVKTSLAPGSRVVSEYLAESGLMPFLEKLGFHIVGFGCTTCIGNSGPLDPEVSRVIEEKELVVVSVLSGNRNFEGRIHPLVRANFLASPPLVVAYSIAGNISIDFYKEPIGISDKGEEIFLKDIWPEKEEVESLMASVMDPKAYLDIYGQIHEFNPLWNEIPVSKSKLFNWNDQSTYIQNPPFFDGLKVTLDPVKKIENARVLVKVRDSITTDHISPAGIIGEKTAAGAFLISRGIEPLDFNTYGSRRGNDKVMTRGTFANIRLKNELAPGTEGGFTIYFPDKEILTIFEASEKYKKDKTPLVVLAGKDYGMGSSRDWAAKGTFLLGVRAVIAASYERIHRSNLVGMGVLPLQFRGGENADTLGIKGDEYFTINIDDGVKPSQEIDVEIRDENGKSMSFKTICRIDTPIEVEYFKNGGILQTVLRKFLRENR